MGGLVITPVEKDFQQLDAAAVEGITGKYLGRRHRRESHQGNALMKDTAELWVKDSPPKSRFDLPTIVKRILEYFSNSDFQILPHNTLFLMFINKSCNSSHLKLRRGQ